MITANNFTIATFNTCGVPSKSYDPLKRYPAICQAFEQLAPDLINLQEVWLYNLLGILKKGLPSYPYVAYRFGPFGPLAGLVTFSRVPLRHPSFFTISSTAAPEERGFFKRIRQAFIQRGVLASQIPERSLIVCNTHLMANMDGKWSKENRYYPAHQDDMRQIAALVQQLTNQEQHLLISGDFNIPKHSDLYPLFVAHSLAIDVFGEDDTPTYRPENSGFRGKPHCLDYIFYRSTTLQAQSHTHILQEERPLANGEKSYLSDHIGLMAEFSLEGQHE